jgi:hypothetical protein
MSDEKILDLGKLPKENLDAQIASLQISVAMNGGYSLVIHFEDNIHPITMIFPSKIELLAVLGTILLK